MPKFILNKLVRDKIVEHQLALGSKPQYRLLDDSQHKEALANKIIEETREILNSDEEKVASEIADVQQALDDLKEKFGVSDADVAKIQKIKNQKNGPFKKGIYIEQLEVAENDRKWTEYYRKDPARFPEIK